MSPYDRVNPGIEGPTWVELVAVSAECISGRWCVVGETERGFLRVSDLGASESTTSGHAHARAMASFIGGPFPIELPCEEHEDCMEDAALGRACFRDRYRAP